MRKIASPAQLAEEISRLAAYCNTVNPSRNKIAEQLLTLANRLSTTDKTAGFEKLVTEVLEGEGFRSGIDFYFEHGLVVKDTHTGVSIVRALNNSSHIRTKAGLKQSGGTWVVTFGEDDEDAHGLKTTIEFLESVRTELWGGKAKAHLEQVARFSNIPEAKKFAQAKSDMLHEMQRAIQDFVEDLKRRHS